MDTPLPTYTQNKYIGMSSNSFTSDSIESRSHDYKDCLKGRFTFKHTGKM